MDRGNDKTVEKMKILKETETYYENESIKIEYFPEKKYIWELYKKFAPTDEIKAAKNKFLNILEEYKPQYFLSDLSKFAGAPTDSHIWVRDFWLPKIFELGIKGFAIIKTKDPYSEMSLKNVLTSENLSVFDIQYFKTVTEAESWILQNIESNKQ